METMANSSPAKETSPLGAQLHHATITMPAKMVSAAAAAAIMVTMLAMGGLAAAAVVTILVVSSPLLLFLSPILIPLGTVVVVVTAALLGSGASALVSLIVIQWLYNYRKGRQPVGSHPLEAAQKAVTDFVKAVKANLSHSKNRDHHKDQSWNVPRPAMPTPSPAAAAAASAAVPADGI